MYEYIKGVFITSDEGYVIVDQQGWGIKVAIPPGHEKCMPKPGEEIFLYLSFIIREFSQAFYGFFQKKERDLFELLLQVSKIGPKTGLNVIGHMNHGEFAAAIQSHDEAAIARIPGIGKKTAERLVLDLKEKIKPFASTDPSSGKLNDALNALIHLGYQEKIAEKAVKKAIAELPADCPLSDLIKAALSI